MSSEEMLKLTSNYDFMSACTSGNLEKINSFDLTPATIQLAFHIAVSHGYEKIVRAKIEDGAVFLDGLAVLTASANGHLKILKLLIKKGSPIPTHALYLATNNGHYNIVRFLVNHNTTITHNLFGRALERGHFEIALFFMEKGETRTGNVNQKILQQYSDYVAYVEKKRNVAAKKIISWWISDVGYIPEKIVGQKTILGCYKTFKQLCAS